MLFNGGQSRLKGDFFFNDRDDRMSNVKQIKKREGRITSRDPHLSKH